MRDIDVTARSRADADAVYRLLVDGAAWPTWSGLGSFELERESAAGGEGVGAIRIFRTWPFTNREEIAEAVPGRRFSYRLLSGMALDGYRADVDLTPDGDGTLIRWHSTFTARRSWMGGFYRWFLGRFIKSCAEGLAKAAAKKVPGLKSPHGADRGTWLQPRTTICPVTTGSRNVRRGRP